MFNDSVQSASVGMGCTVKVGSDSYGCTVVYVAAKRVVARQDNAEQVGDYFGSQKWIHTPSAEGREFAFTLRTIKGQKVWAEEGREPGSSARLIMGVKHSHRDPSY